MESVFIAWSGNNQLAKCLADELASKGYEPIIGGGSVQDLFIGAQVIGQMNRCTYAIILAQKKEDITSHAEFSDNIMFEWGYLIARLSPRKIFAFLIDTHERELPSDLIGSWTIPIRREGKDDRSLAADLIMHFEIEMKSMDKLEIISRYKQVKTILAQYQSKREYSDFEMAQFVLFSVKAAYYHNDIPAYLRLLKKIKPNSSLLQGVIEEAQVVASLFTCTDNLAQPLKPEDYFEISTALSFEYEHAIDNADLHDWAKIIRLDALSLCHILMATSSEQAEREYFNQESVARGEQTVEAIEKNVAEHPENLEYSRLFKGYQHRNQAIAAAGTGDLARAEQLVELSVADRERLYFHYRHEFPDDQVVLNKLAQEYYLSLLERAQYETNPMEKRRIMMTVQTLMANWEADFASQQALLEMVRRAYAKLT